MTHTEIDTGPPHTRTGAREVLRRWMVAAGLLVFFLLGGLVLAATVGTQLGPQAVALATLAAVLPLGIVVPAFLWLDRYEAEPRGHLVFAFCWGALIATTVALVLNTGSLEVLSTISPDSEALTAVVVAPVVEEALKGLGVLLILLFQRREFDGIIDGIVYAGLAAAGFAFAENILYLGRAFAELGAQGLVAVFVVRCIFGPFAHPLFTCCVGVGIGVAATAKSRWARIAGPVIGFAAAVSLHALWNLSSVLGLQGFVTRYLLLQLPIFVVAILFATWARRREGRLIAKYLTPYVQTGWLSAPEATMLAALPARHAARRWARDSAGAQGGRAMKDFQDTASELALLRMRIEHGTAYPGALAGERVMLYRLTEARAGWSRR